MSESFVHMIHSTTLNHRGVRHCNSMCLQCKLLNISLFMELLYRSSCAVFCFSCDIADISVHYYVFYKERSLSLSRSWTDEWRIMLVFLQKGLASLKATLGNGLCWMRLRSFMLVC